MIPAPAEYLLRCDDLCPTMSVERWQRVESLIEEFQLQPILAVIPDNRDPELEVSCADLNFFERMRRLEACGAIIGLHGYRHLCESRGHSLLGLARTSEFAGVPAQTQREWVHEGLRILRGHGLEPRIWVAPRHGFDRRTLDALCSEGITLVSDGFARVPFLRCGLTWIPQQLWGPLEKNKGIWTICVHSNFIHTEQVEQLYEFIRSHTAQFTSLNRVLAEFPPDRLGLIERLHESWALWRARVAQAKRRRKLRSRKKSNA